MQIIYKDKDKRRSSGEADIVDLIIHTEKVSKCMEGKHIERSKGRFTRI